MCHSIMANLASTVPLAASVELKTIITKGMRPNGSPMMPPTTYGYYATMTDDDVDTITLYLRQIPPLPSPG